MMWGAILVLHLPESSETSRKIGYLSHHVTVPQLPSSTQVLGPLHLNRSACCPFCSTLTTEPRPIQLRSKRRDESKNDPAGLDRGQKSLFSAHQVLTLPTTGTGDTRRLSQ